MHCCACLVMKHLTMQHFHCCCDKCASALVHFACALWCPSLHVAPDNRFALWSLSGRILQCRHEIAPRKLSKRCTWATPHLTPHKPFVYTNIPQHTGAVQNQDTSCAYDCRYVLSEDGPSDAEQGITTGSNSNFQQIYHKDRARTDHIEEEDVLP